MARIGLVGGSYTSQSRNADAQQSMNWYPEAIEDPKGKVSSALYPTPGLAVFCTLPEVPVRGQVVTQGRTFAVGGSQFCETTGGMVTAIGTIANDSKPVSMAVGTTQILIASAGTPYVFTIATNALIQLPAATLANVAQVEYSDGFFLALLSGSETFQASALLDATTWPPLSTSTANVFVDVFQDILVDHREVWMFGTKRTQVYYDSGNFPFPFDVVPSGVIEQGIGAPNSSVRLDNSVFWIGGDERGNAVAWRAQGYTPSRVSNHAVEFAWQGYATISDAVGYSYQDQGHSFWVIYFPTPSKTWVYDVATGMWHERAYWNEINGIFTAHRSQNHIFAGGKHLVGDPFSGNIYQMSISLLDDAGNPIRRVRRAPHISTEQEWIFHQKLQVDMEAGLGPQPPLTQPSSNPSAVILQDTSLVNWAVTVTDAGIIHTTVTGALATPQTLFLNDSTLANTSWQVKISTGGILSQNATTFSAAYPTTLALSTTPSGYVVSVSVQSGILQQSAPFPIPRSPQLSLRWSDDGGHTWSNYHTVDVGQAGKFITRAIWRRLGRSRDRVYEISATDPIPWRILEADLVAVPGFQPAERLTKQYEKVY